MSRLKKRKSARKKRVAALAAVANVATYIRSKKNEIGIYLWWMYIIYYTWTGFYGIKLKETVIRTNDRVDVHRYRQFAR